MPCIGGHTDTDTDPSSSSSSSSSSTSTSVEQLIRCDDVEVGREDVIYVVAGVFAAITVVCALTVHAVCAHLEYRRTHEEYMKLRSAMKVRVMVRVRTRESGRADGGWVHASRRRQ